MRAKRRRWDAERQQEAVALYLSGLSIMAVAWQVKTSRRNVGRAVKAAGVLRAKKDIYRGAGNPAWKGGRQIDDDGYVLLHMPEHPDANKKGQVREHRLVMEKHLGRRLLATEVVHHKKARDDNRIENLELFASNAEHLQCELTGRCPSWTPEGKARTRAAHDAWCERRRALRKN